MAQQFKIYRSSAGSGKTFTLTKEFLKLIIGCPGSGGAFDAFYFRHILAVTFTNLAANEMKERILEYLAGMSAEKRTGQAQQMLDLVMEELPLEYAFLQNLTEEIASDRAKQAYEAILHHYADLSVSTIDSFNQRIVQAFKKDLGLPYNYELTLEEKDLIEEAVERLLKDLDQDSSPIFTRLMVEFVLNGEEETTKNNIEFELMNFGENLLKEDQRDVIGLLKDWKPEQYEQLKKSISKFVKDKEKQWIDPAKEAIQAIAAQDISPLDFAKKKNGIGARLQKISQLSPGQLGNASVLGKEIGYLQKMVAAETWYTKTAGAHIQAAIDALIPSLSETIRQIHAQWQQTEGALILAHEVKKYTYLLATLQQLEKELAELRWEKDVVMISDINDRIYEVVQHDPVPYLYERIGERYWHILIDEFQDTSRKQWHNLLPLVTNGLNRDALSLVVGDAKQSIYQFRGGKPELLVDLPAVPSLSPDSPLKPETITLHNEAAPHQLNTNYRSLPAIIGFNNQLFQFLKKVYADDFTGVERFYEDVEQQPHKKDGGQVSIRLIARENQQVFEEAVFEQTLQRIETLQAAGYPLSDIVILTRSKRKGVFLAKKLMDAGVNVVSEEALLLLSSPVVAFLYRTLQLLAGKGDQSLWMLNAHFLREHAEALRLNWAEGKSAGDWYAQVADWVKELPAEAIWDAFQKEISQGEQALSVSAFSELQLMTTFELTETLVREFALFRRNEQQAYLHSFLEMTRNFAQQPGSGLNDLLEWVERKKDDLAIKSSVTEEAVRVLTIHKSKGLQFPVVLVPFADWQTSPQPTSKLWLENTATEDLPEIPALVLGVNQSIQQTSLQPLYDKEQETAFLEALNLLYVALTRPEEQLHIISAFPKGRKNNVQALLWQALEAGAFQEASPEAGIKEREAVTREGLGYSYTFWEVGTGFTQERKEAFEKELEKKKEKKVSVEAEKNQTERLTGFIHTQNAKTVRYRSEELVFEEKEESVGPRKLGEALHEVLEKITHVEQEIAPLLAPLAQKSRLTATDEAHILAMVQKVMQHPKLQPFFQPEIHQIISEQDMIDPIGNGRIHRADRILLNGKEATILDYKTGKKEDSLTEKHKKQVNRYAQLLQQMGFSVKEKLLIYTEMEESEMVVGW